MKAILRLSAIGLLFTGSVDLVAVNGYYDVVSMTLNVARVKAPAGAETPFKQAGE
ncbi:hypothetical protein [Bradyrhizobium sp.]|uniref:hypothetical protein n=1 Tax=Bradyrhizobium sp. TaxID=376 RepID=UPI003C40E758